MIGGSFWLLRIAAIGLCKLLTAIRISSAATIVAVLVTGLSAPPAVSLPLYARQTGQTCATCHTAFLELTPFGRRFKLGGYTLGGGDWKGPPFAIMLQPTFTNTQAAQPGGAAPGFGVNNNFVLQQASLFTGGKITDNLGAFIRERGTASATALPGTIRTYASQSRSTSTATLSSGGEPSTTTRPSRTSGTRFRPGAFPT